MQWWDLKQPLCKAHSMLGLSRWSKYWWSNGRTVWDRIELWVTCYRGKMNNNGFSTKVEIRKLGELFT